MHGSGNRQLAECPLAAELEADGEPQNEAVYRVWGLLTYGKIGL